MDTIVQVFPGGVVTREQQEELHIADHAIVRAISAMKLAGVPQGLIVALLHGHAHAQTTKMVEGKGY